MMKRKVKVLMCSALAAVSVMATGISALAANPSYSFYLQNNGTRYTYDSGSYNNKVYAAQNWSLYVSSINFSSGVTGWGMSFIPIKSGTLTKGGDAHWRTSIGTTYGTYGSYGGAKGGYYLGARIDDDLSGYGAASGRWNSDYVNF